MEQTHIQILMLGLLVLGLGIYWFGKKNNISLLRVWGKTSSLILFVLIIVDTVFIRKQIL